METETLVNSLWEENKFWVFARSRNLYDDVAATVADKAFRQTHRLLEQTSAMPEYNFDAAADEMWAYLQEIVENKEREEWDSLEKEEEILTKKDFLWKLILRYRVTSLYNTRLLLDINPFDRFLFIAANQKKLYLWNGVRVKEIDFGHIIKKSSRLHDPNYLLTILVNGHPYRNPKLQAP